jgi:fatty-acyl-CoA synthase
VALVDLHRGRETGYGELAARVRAVAWSLRDRYGLGAGDRVAVLSRNAEAFTADGRLRTGDAATTTGDGHLVLVDRWKDMFVSGGENVYPAEIENALHAHPAVSQAAVVGAPDPRWGEAGVAFVVLGRGAAAEPRELLDRCRQRLAAYQVPVRVLLVPELPRNATGKLLKGPLRTAARADGAGAG